jgi:hypothetical protein
MSWTEKEWLEHMKFTLTESFKEVRDNHISPEKRAELYPGLVNSYINILKEERNFKTN